MTFSNGDRLTAEDVAFTIQTAIKDRWTVVTFLGSIASATASNPTTVVVSLSQPDVTIPANLALLFVVPKAYYTSIGAMEFRMKPVGTGPYDVAEFRPNDLIRYSLRAASHPLRRPQNREIRFLQIPEPQQLLNGLITGDLDIVTNVQFSANQADQLKKAKVDLQTGFDSSYLIAMPQGSFETRKTPLTNVKVRQALNYAVNRSALAKSVFGDYAQPSGQLMYPESYYYDASQRE